MRSISNTSRGQGITSEGCKAEIERMTYVPKKGKPSVYEGKWSGPFLISPQEIRCSHNTSHLTPIASGYEDQPIRIQRWPSVGYTYRIVDGNKRLAKAKRAGQTHILAYIFEGL